MAMTSTAIRHTAWNVATNSIGSPRLDANLRHAVRSRATWLSDLGHSAVAGTPVGIRDMIAQDRTWTAHTVLSGLLCPSFRQSAMRNCSLQNDLLAWP